MSAFRFSTQPGDILQEMATKVRQLRKQSGYSQEELARRSGVSFGSIKRFESSGQISFESLLKIAQVFDRLDDFTSVIKPGEDPEGIRKLFDQAQ